MGTLCQPQRQALPQIGGATTPHQPRIGQRPDLEAVRPDDYEVRTRGKGAGGYSLQGGYRTETRLDGPFSPLAQHEKPTSASRQARNRGFPPGSGDGAKRDANRPAKGARHDSRLKGEEVQSSPRDLYLGLARMWGV